MENLDTIIKLIGLLGSVLGIWKLTQYLASDKRKNLREEYKFAKSFLKDRDTENLHQFTLEKGYQAIAGSKSVTSSEIAYILRLNNPVRSLNDYIFANDYLEHSKTKDGSQISFKKRYQAYWSRLWRMGLYGVFYCISISIAELPLLLELYGVKQTNFEFAYMFIFTLPLGILLGWLSLKAFLKLMKANRVVNNQVVIDR